MSLPKTPALIGKLFPIVVALFLSAGPAAAQSPKPDMPAPTSTGPTLTAPTSTRPTSTAPAEPAPSPIAAPGPTPVAAQPTASSTDTATPPISSDDKTTAGTGSALIPHDLSPYGMFLHADIIVQVVMVGLAFASLVTWTILLVKALELVSARRRAVGGVADLAAATTLREASGRFADAKAPVARIVRAALDEEERSQGLPADGVKERATALLSRIESRAGRAMARGTGLLATIGSTAPFVGLFGTVWGIMNSFIGISKTNTTNLAVVAPGIAEALLATAFGLVAAIPAVIIYNMFARAITGYRAVLGDASTEALRLLSRDLDRAQATGRPIGRAAAE